MIYNSHYLGITSNIQSIFLYIYIQNRASGLINKLISLFGDEKLSTFKWNGYWLQCQISSTLLTDINYSLIVPQKLNCGNFELCLINLKFCHFTVLFATSIRQSHLFLF